LRLETYGPYYIPPNINEGTKLLASITTDPPNETAVPFIVMLELVRLELPILLKVLDEPDIVLFVRVFDDVGVTVMSLVKATVPVAVGKVKVPVLLMLEIIGLVKVLFVSVCAVVLSTVVAVSMETVTVPLDPPPERPVPAVTPVISPAPI
jgi:hypothetical protein